MEKNNTSLTSHSLLMNVEAVADALHLSVRTVWQYSKNGIMPPPVHVGKAARWRRSELMEWIEEGCPPVDKNAKKGASQ